MNKWLITKCILLSFNVRGDFVGNVVGGLAACAVSSVKVQQNGWCTN